MSTRGERDKSKVSQDRFQMILSALLKDEDNKYCVDCDAKGPRWASHNLGIFMCIRCAGIHRNLGVHISKVKSVNLDTWTNEQVAMMQEIGNSRGRAVYEANIPDHFRRPQTDSSLEAFIRAKYEHKKYQAHGWVPPKPTLQPPPEEPKKEKKKTRPRPEATNVKLTPATTAKKPSPVQSESFASHTSASWPEMAATQKEKPESNIDDLLGLDTECAGSPSGDLFSDFMSAPVADTNIQTSAVSAPSSEIPSTGDNGAGNSQPLSGLFDQGDSESKEQSKEPPKSTKESIMSLFGPSTTQNANQNVGYNMQVPQQGGMMMGMPGMQQNGMAYNGMQQCYPGMQQQQAQPNMMQGGQQPAMMGMQMQGGLPGGGMPPQSQASMMPGQQQAGVNMMAGQQQAGMMAGQQQAGMMAGQQQAGMMAGQQPAMYNMNMYGAMQQQQMSQVQGGLSGMSLGGGAGFSAAASGSAFSSQPGLMSNGWSSTPSQITPSSGHTLSTNLWQ